MMNAYRAYLTALGLSSPMALEGFLDAAPDAIVVVDWSGNIVIVNHLAERLFGYSRQELLGIPIEGLVPQRFSEQHAKHRNNYSRDSESRCCIAILNTSSSEPRTTRSLVSNIASSPGDNAAWGSTC